MPTNQPLPVGWESTTVEDITSVVTKGTTPKTLGFEYLKNGEVRFVKVESLFLGKIQHEQCASISLETDDALSRSRLRCDDILFSIAGTLGRTAIVTDEDLPANTNQALAIIRLIETDSHFVRFFLDSTVSQRSVEDGKRGMGLQNLNLTQVKSFQVPLPPLNEQRRIAAKIDSLQSKSRTAREALEKVQPLLEKFRQSVLAAAFRGDLTAEWREQNPDVEPASELLERIRVERRQRWEEAELAKMEAKGKTPKNDKWKAKYKEPEPVDTAGLPELPEGWCWASVEELIVGNMGNGISVRGSDVPPGVPALKLNALTETGIDYSKIRYIPITGEKAEKLSIQENDFLVSRGNGTLSLVGKGCVASLPATQTVFPDTVIRIQLANSIIESGWVQLVWASPFVRQQIEKKAKTTAGIWKVSQADLKSIILPIPPRLEQIELNAVGNGLLAKQLEISSHCTNLRGRITSLDQSILAKAFRGELVPQDPNDEPASVLLERIRAEREAQKAKGKKKVVRRKKVAK